MNRFTAVPSRPPSPLTGPTRLLLPLADACMAAMGSRPASGSLRSTWVTPATLWLAAVSCAAAVLIAAALSLNMARWPEALAASGAGVAAVLAIGTASIVAVGAAQRRAH